MARFLASLCFILALVTPNLAEAKVDDTMVLESVSAAVVIQPDGLFTVDETITVTFPEPRHGIFRVIPVRYRTASGNRVSIGVTVEGVRKDDRPVQYDVSKEGDDLSIQIGDPATYVTGTQTYRVSYRVERALLAFDDHDELYWNMTGTAWPTTPESVEANVYLPKGMPAGSVRAVCYTGAYGSTASDCRALVANPPDGTTAVSVTAHDFLTIAVAFPKGFVTMPTALQRIGWFFADNWLALLPLAVLAALFAYWWKHGRDPRRNAIVTQFDPPEKLRPGEVGVLIDGKVHDRDISATIVDLAVRGYLKIIEREEKGILSSKKLFTLERTAKSADDLQEYEREILAGVFGAAMTRDLEKMQSRASEMVTHRRKASDLLYRMLVDKKWYVKNPEVVRNAFVFIGGAGIFLCFFIGFPLSIRIALLVSCVFVVLFGFIMPKRTEEGTRVFEYALGFKTYLERAEEYRLKWQEQQNVFESFLPYAMVFGVVDKWTNALQSVINQPDWYQSSHPGAWNYLYFNSAMHDFNHSLGVAVSVKPQSKASSGGSGFSGGFSGGGFGGGGGGSW